MDLIEIKNQSDLELYHYYILRDNILYKTKNLNSFNIGEEYCLIFTTPSTPPDIVLSVEKKTNDYLKIFNTHLREVINIDYFTIDGIKSFLKSGEGFKNYWEL